MKKFTALLMALIICCSMVIGVSATSDAVEAVPVTTQEIPTTESTADAIGGFISGFLGGNLGDVNEAVGTIENLSATVSKVLAALDDFLRGLRLFVDQFFSNILGNGSMPF